MDQKKLTNPFLAEKNFPKETLINSLKTGDKSTFLTAIAKTNTFMLRDAQGNTLLHLAIIAPKNALFLTNALLELGKIPVNSRNEAKETPLYLAVKGGDITLVRLLMADHANPYAQNHEGKTPISLAILEKKSNILNVLTGITVVDTNLERLALRENILNLTDETNLLTDILNQLPYWLQKLPLEYHATLLNLQKNLPDRRLSFDAGKEVKNKKTKDDSSSSKTKEKKSETKFSASLKSIRTTIETTIEKEKKNKRIGEILELLNSLITSLKKENNDQYKGILNDLEKLFFYYESLPDKEITENKKLSEQLRVQIPSVGYRDLSEAAAKRFSRYFMKSEERKKEVSYKANEHGLHDVIQMNSVHYKIDPTAPGIEYAVLALGELFTDQVSTPTEIVVVEKSSVNEQNEIEIQFLPVLASQTVSGILFHDLIEQDATAAQKIDPHNFGLHFILALLTDPVDGKLSNFFAKPQLNEDGQLINYTLVSIDSDEAFAEPIFATPVGTTKKYSLMLKTCIFCLPQMDAPIDMVLRKQLLKLNPAILVLRWLQLLAQYNEPFEGRSIVTHHLKKVFSSVGLPQKLVPKTAIKLYEKFCKIQALLREQPELTHIQLLEKYYPLVKFYYDYARKESNDNLSKSMDLVYRGKFFHELTLSSDQKEALNKFTETSSAYKNKREQSIAQAIEEFCETLDFEKFDIETQQAILKELTTAFPNIKHLTLKKCDALNDETMQEMSKNFKNLSHIKLCDCRIFTAKGVHALLQRLPGLQITLQGFEALKPHDLLTISRFCSRLHLILPDGSKHLVDKKNKFLLPTALKQNNINLITFLLLAGFHLTDETQTYSPLHDAIKQKNASLVRELIYYYSDTNQYVGKLSPLDRAYQLLQTMPASDTGSINQLRLIIAFLLEAGAVETASPEAILEIGKKNWQEQISQENKSKFAKALINFALAHNQLNPILVNVLVDANDDIIDWSRQRPFGYQISDPTFQALFALIKNANKPITTLNLSGCAGITKQHIQICSQLNIKTLILDFQQAIETGLIKENDLGSLLKSKGIYLQINAIQLNGKKAVQEQFDQLIHVLSQPENEVKRLEITNSALSTKQIQEFSSALSKQSQLKRVILRAIGLGQNTTNGASHFSFLMKGLTSQALVELCLDENDLKAENMPVFVKWLKNHSELMELSFYGNPLGDQGILNLGSGLAHCQKLKKLNLNQVNLTDDGFEKWLFSHVPSSALIQTQNRIPPRLSFLDIGYNKLTAASISYIMETIRLNESLSQFFYAGQPDLEKGISLTKLTELLQRNALLNLQQILLEPYQQHFFQTNFQKQHILSFFSKPVSDSSETKTILAITQLIVTFEEEIDEIEEMIKNPWLYQEERKALIDQEIEYNDFDQTALECDILYLSKSKNKTSQEQIAQLRDQIDVLAIQQDALRLQYDRKVAYQTAISAFNQDPDLCFFYCMMRLKLEKLFTQSKLVMNTPTSQVLFDQKINLNQAKYIDQLGTLKILLKVAEKTARYLTETFQKTIKNITKQSKIFDEKTKKDIENVAEEAMGRILKALESRSIRGNTVSLLVNKFISAGCGVEIEIAVFLGAENIKNEVYTPSFSGVFHEEKQQTNVMTTTNSTLPNIDSVTTASSSPLTFSNT